MTVSNLTSEINKKFKTNFKINQIRYQVNKFIEESFGKPDADASHFAALAKEETEEHGEAFYLETDQQNSFKRCLFVSSTMLQYSQSFLDIVLIDATYKKNRFSLPLVNIIGFFLFFSFVIILGINNYGHNIMLAFALLQDETLESYQWLFYNLKTIWKKNPLNIISDECESIQQGKI